MGFELDDHQCSEPPRSVPWAVRLDLFFGGWRAAIWGVLGFLSIFGWTFGGNADVAGLFLDPDTAVVRQGVVTRVEPTGASVMDKQVIRYDITFTGPSGEHRAVSYGTGSRLDQGDEVEVIHPPGEPEAARIAGQRGAMFPGGLVLMWLPVLVLASILLLDLRKRLRQIRLLRDGVMVRARCLARERASVQVNGRQVYKLRLGYADDLGEAHDLELRTSRMSELAEEDTTWLLYDASDPRRGIAVARLPEPLRLSAEGMVTGSLSRSAMAGMGLAALSVIGNLAALFG